MGARFTSGSFRPGTSLLRFGKFHQLLHRHGHDIGSSPCRRRSQYAKWRLENLRDHGAMTAANRFSQSNTGAPEAPWSTAKLLKSYVLTASKKVERAKWSRGRQLARLSLSATNHPQFPKGASSCARVPINTKLTGNHSGKSVAGSCVTRHPLTLQDFEADPDDAWKN